MTKIIVGMSGGVDSSLTAALLLEQGHAVEGLFMFNWSEDEDAYCTAAEDYREAARVAADLGISLHRADFSARYRERVFAHFLDEYRAGRTPSPDLLCNREIKFGSFLAHARNLGAEQIATGHYARLRQDADGPHLLLAADQDKDQTYFLADVRPEALAEVRFPLGDFTKPQVRRMAAERGLHNYQRKDSTGICFIGERPMREFLARYLDGIDGDIVDDGGRVLGKHPGLCYFTIGQRRGLGIGGQAHAADAPWYVYAKELDGQRLRVTQDPEHPLLHCSRAVLSEPHWIRQPAQLDGWVGQARIRHRQVPQDCRLEREDERWILRFARPQWAIAAGQYAVLYAGEECLGCAVIDAARPTDG